MKPTFSFSWEGSWTKAQLDAALEILIPEGKAQGIEFRPATIEYCPDGVPRFTIFAQCTKHSEMLLGGECKRCEREPS